VFAPCLLVLIGIGLAKIKIFIDSPDRLLSPDLYPLRQRITVNSDTQVASTFTPKDFVRNLPDSERAFSVFPTIGFDEDVYEDSETDVLTAFGNAIYQNRNVGPGDPYRYGSYYLYQADAITHQYKIATIVNSTSQDAPGAFPAFAYESILRLATRNQNFNLKFINSPFPVAPKIRDDEKQVSSFMIIFIVAIGFALIPASIASGILHEREANLKH